MDFATYTVVFCVVIGLGFGTVGFALRVLFYNRHGAQGDGMDRNEDGEVKVLSFWNMSLATFAAIVGLAIASHFETTYVARAVKRSWDYFVAQGYQA